MEAKKKTRPDRLCPHCNRVIKVIMRNEHAKVVDCPHCGVLTLEARYGYDLKRVASTHCTACHKPIGSGDYVEDAGLARFGQMLICHAECGNQAKSVKNAQLLINSVSVVSGNGTGN